ncbi:MAG: phosphate-starvation-inducible PsiE family protein [Chlorobiaceae bacterium]|nr:phosphate-starvation-inducible PsiE family protein [Chlorobiaceae bacterium]NTV61488.1 phosphate-starvation-inducible PsiE family protein [Chlorobiaceae bacterium]
MMSTFEDRLLGALRAFNHILHALLALALVLASIMVIWEFSFAVYQSIEQNNLAHGFLQALGTLFIVWTLSSLIAAEINYVQTGVFHVVVFIEVAMITLLRQLIVEPVKIVTAGGNLEQVFNAWHYGLLLAALLVIGILHKLVTSSDKKSAPEDERPDDQLHGSGIRGIQG